MFVAVGRTIGFQRCHWCVSSQRAGCVCGLCVRVEDHDSSHRLDKVSRKTVVIVFTQEAATLMMIGKASAYKWFVAFLGALSFSRLGCHGPANYGIRTCLSVFFARVDWDCRCARIVCHSLYLKWFRSFQRANGLRQLHVHIEEHDIHDHHAERFMHLGMYARMMCTLCLV